MAIKVTDPDTCTKFNRSQVELEEFLCFCIAVAGKTARVVKKCMRDFWLRAINDSYKNVPSEPFELLAYFRVEQIAQMLKDAGIGCHTVKATAMKTAAHELQDLKTVTLQELESICGIGPKTSRFFILHTRRRAKVACLDTHILRWMREQGIETPKTTPTGRRYLELEQQFLSMVPKGKSVAKFDLEIWKRYRR